MNVKHLSFRAVIVAISTILLILAPAQAEETSSLGDRWSELPRPNMGQGLMMEPQLAAHRSRVHLVWVGTSDNVRRPEVFHSSITKGDKEWRRPVAPFFGKNLGRVRKVGIGVSRDLVALIFQRTLTQATDAYEVRMSFSRDQGWEWGPAVEVDSYVAEKSGGTWVAIEGRQGMNRPEFALAWVRDFGNIRAANIDISSSLRPEGTLIGEHTPGAMKADVAALGKDGFIAVFNDGQGIASSHIRGLTGKIEMASTAIKGRFGSFFTLSSRPFGPARLAVGSDRTVEVFTSDGIDLKHDTDETLTLPFSTMDVQVESAMDDDKNLHLLMVVPKAEGFTVWYAGQKKRKWGELEKVAEIDTKEQLRGFDIAVAGDFVVAAISEGFRAQFFQRK